PDICTPSLHDALPIWIRAGSARKEFFREIYFDTVGADLDRRGVSARLTIRSDGVRTLAVDVQEREGADGELVRSHSVAEVEAAEPDELFALDSEPARLLRSMLEPDRLTVRLELETTRRRRSARMEGVEGEIGIALDAVTLRQGDAAVDFFEMEIALPTGDDPPARDLLAALRAAHGLVVTFSPRIARAREVLDAIEVDRLQREVMNTRQVAVVAQRDGELALLQKEEGLRVPLGI